MSTEVCMGWCSEYFNTDNVTAVSFFHVDVNITEMKKIVQCLKKKQTTQLI